MAIDRTVPSERNNTYDPSDVSRKTNEDLFETAFNSDQQRVLNNIIADIPQPTPPGPEVPEPTASDNGKVLGVRNGEYALTNARSDIPKASAANSGKVLGVTANGGMYAFVDKDSPVEEVIFNGAHAYKVGKIAYVSYTGNGIMFPPISQGGLTVQMGSLEVADIALSGSKILAYVRGTDATRRYGVVAENNNGKAQLYLIDATNMTPVSETVTIWDNFCIPCK